MFSCGMSESQPYRTPEGRDPFGLAHQLRAAVSVPLRSSRKELKWAAIVDISIEDLTEKIVRSILCNFEVRWKGSDDTSEDARKPDQPPIY